MRGRLEHQCPALAAARELNVSRKQVSQTQLAVVETRRKTKYARQNWGPCSAQTAHLLKGRSRNDDA